MNTKVVLIAGGVIGYVGFAWYLNCRNEKAAVAQYAAVRGVTFPEESDSGKRCSSV